MHGGHHLAHGLAASCSHGRRALHQRIGTAGGIGVAADGVGQLVHRRSRFFQVGRLLLGALREIMVAGDDLAHAHVQPRGGLLDAGDDAAELADGGIGIVAHAREHALQVAFHAHAQVTPGQCCQQRLQVAQVGFERGQQVVDAGGQRAHEALLALQGDAAVQFAVCGGVDQRGHFGFQQGFQRAAAPFHRHAEEVILVDDRVGDELVAHAKVIDLALLATAHARQAGHRRVQAHGIAANECVGLHAQLLQQSGIGVGHLPFRIDHHQPCLCAVQCLAHAGVAASHRAFLLDAHAQALLHVDQALRQLADLIVGVVHA